MATKMRVTLEEFLALPDTEPGSEYIDGEVEQKAMPDEPHAMIQVWFGAALLNAFELAGRGRVYTEMRYIFGPAGRQRAFLPDVSLVTHERRAQGLAARPANARSRHLYAAPTLAVEVLSPDQGARRFAEKIQFYLAHGVDVTWVIDPIEETITVFRIGADSLALVTGDVLEEPDLLPGFSLSVEDVFARVREEGNQ